MELRQSSKNCYNSPQVDVIVKCEASRSGLGATTEQKKSDGRKRIAFFSGFLYTAEVSNNAKVLKFLGFAWSIDYFKKDLYGKNLTVITDHRAILTKLKEHESFKSYNSSFSRWIDRLLPYNFNIDQLPGTKIGLVDYISRNPFSNAKKISASHVCI